MEYQQRQLVLIGEIREPGFVEPFYVERWRSEHDAILTCWAKRRTRYSVRDAAARLGMPASHLSNIINGKKHLPNGSTRTVSAGSRRSGKARRLGNFGC